MSEYLPSTEEQRKAMLDAIGAESVSALYADVPQTLQEQAAHTLPQDGVSELEALSEMERLSEKNTHYSAVFRGAGAYMRYIPPIVRRVTAKEAFVTAYTPYQPEISQGVLQSIFEYQTMICELTGMDVSNASVYDGAEAAAEATTMCRERNRTRVLVSAAANPQAIETIQTYCFGSDAQMELIPQTDGRTDPGALEALLSADVSCVYVASPNHFGVIEDVSAFAEKAHMAGAKLIVGMSAIAAPLLKTPFECGADIAVGDGQPLGIPLSFGGPYLGFMACRKEHMRRLPGRIVGETQDRDGRRCFVLTLQAREQHIRREKASSNICSNQALCAMTAAVYMASMGKTGMTDAAKQSYDKAHYLADRLAKAGYAPRYPNAPFFHEFVTESPIPTERLLSALKAQGILGGLPIDGGVLWCATEINTKAQIDRLVEIAEKEAKHA